MKTILTILLAFTVSAGWAQTKQKWVENGCSTIYFDKEPDTLAKCYVLQGKDSLTYTIATKNCNCDFYTTIGDHKIHPCKGLKIHTIETHFMYWRKDVTFVKGIKISETKPHWDSNMSQGNIVQGEYEQNGKVAYVAKIHLYKHKLINQTQPYKFASEWVTVSIY